MSMGELAAVAAALMLMAAGSLFSAAQAATLKFETIYRITSQTPDYASVKGTPLIVEVEYDDTGVTSASYSVNGMEGAFDTASWSGFYYNATRPGAYGKTITYGVRLDLGISDDELPFNVDLKNLAFLFATEPGETNPSAPYTEAELVAFFDGATTAMATDYMYFNPAANRMNFYTGAFEGFSFLAADDGGDGGTDPVLETPLPAAGLLMLGGLGAFSAAFRRRKAA